jgi:probable phosphoglycerate mutase
MTIANPDPARFFLIRHGSTAWSVSGRHTGLTDIGLTEQGEAEARRLQPALRRESFAQAWVSPLQRAQRTCELAGLKSEARIDPDLVEWDYGDYEGLRSADIHQHRPGWVIFRDGCPNGETPQQVSDRADRVIARLHAATSTLALFSHGHFGAVLAARWIGLPILDAQHLPLATASISVLGYDTHHPETTVIQQWNSLP